MAFEADCGVSTVLEENRVTSTAGFLVPGEWRTTDHQRPTDSTLRMEGPSRERAEWELKTKTKNSKLFRGVGGKSEFRIPKSEFNPR